MIQRVKLPVRHDPDRQPGQRDHEERQNEIREYMNVSRPEQA